MISENKRDRIKAISWTLFVCSILTGLTGITRLTLALAINLKECQFDTNLFMLGAGWYGALGPLISSIFGFIASRRNDDFHKWLRRTIAISLVSGILSSIIYTISILCLTAGWVVKSNTGTCIAFHNLWLAESILLFSKHSHLNTKPFIPSYPNFLLHTITSTGETVPLQYMLLPPWKYNQSKLHWILIHFIQLIYIVSSMVLSESYDS